MYATKKSNLLLSNLRLVFTRTARSAMRVLPVVIMCLSVTTRTKPSPGEKLGFHHMIAWSLWFLVSKFPAAGLGYSPRTRASKRGNPQVIVILPLLARLA